MTRQFVMVGLLLSLPATAMAQSANVSLAAFDPNQATAPIDMVEGRGVKIGEGTTLFPAFGAQTGFVSNVFYQEADPTAAGMLRLSAQVGAGSLGGLRLVPAEVTPTAEQQKGSFEYRAELRLAYDFMLS